jgi:hypothetical protein
MGSDSTNCQAKPFVRANLRPCPVISARMSVPSRRDPIIPNSNVVSLQMNDSANLQEERRPLVTGFAELRFHGRRPDGAVIRRGRHW